MNFVKIVVIKQGELIILKLDTGEGILYTVTNNLFNPFSLIKTLSEKEVNEYETPS